MTSVRRPGRDRLNGDGSVVLVRELGEARVDLGLECHGEDRAAPGTSVLRAHEQVKATPIPVRLHEKVVGLSGARDRFTTTLYPAPASFGPPRGVVTIWSGHHALCAARLRARAQGTERVSCVARRTTGVVIVRFRPGHDYRDANLVVHVANLGERPS